MIYTLVYTMCIKYPSSCFAQNIAVGCLYYTQRRFFAVQYLILVETVQIHWATHTFERMYYMFLNLCNVDFEHAIFDDIVICLIHSQLL